MKILLTGGAGYIGTHTAVELLSRGCDIAVADDFSNSKPAALARVREITGRDFAEYRADVRDAAAMDALFEAERPDAIIHFAGLKAVGESVKKPLDYYDNNLNSTITLCRMMKKHGVKTIIFSSSATVYGTPESPVGEGAPTGGCTNPYGWTKYMSEQILRDAAAAEEGWFVGLLRYFNPIGAHESGLIGEDPNGIPNNLLPNVTQAAIGKREYLSVFGTDYDTPDGTGVRDYIHVVDLARGHADALKYAESHRGLLTVNLGTGRGCGVLELVHAFERATGVKVPYKLCPRRPGDVAVNYADASLAGELLGWRAEKSIEDMCRDSWNWQKKNPDGYPD